MIGKLLEVRIIGLGGQGAVVGAEILADAVFREGKWSQMIPQYGGVRRGSVVQGFVRIDEKMITLNTSINTPDIIVVLDPKIQKNYPIAQGLKQGGMAILNSEQSPEEVDLGVKLSKISTIDATRISREILGPQPIPITNTIMIGAFSKATGVVKLESLFPRIKENFPGKTGDINIAMVKAGYERCKVACLETPK